MTDEIARRMEQKIEEQKDHIRQLQATLAEREARRLREALKFYADPQSYGINGGTVDRIIQDAGKQAQRALKGA